jgi:hypothetical protein
MFCGSCAVRWGGTTETALGWNALIGALIGAGIPATLVYVGLHRQRQSADTEAFGPAVLVLDRVNECGAARGRHSGLPLRLLVLARGGAVLHASQVKYRTSPRRAICSGKM